MNRAPAIAAYMAAVALAGCGQNPAPAPFIDLFALSKPPVVTARDGGASVLVGDRVLWMFGDTLMTVTAADGFNYRSATAAWSSVTAPNALEEPLESTGAPSQLFPYTADEAAYNAAHGPMERYALWPGSAIAAPDGSGAWLFYQRLLIHPGDLNYQGLDVGLARLAPGATVATRDPAPIFTAPAPAYTLAALVDGGFVYLYAVDAVPGQLDSVCRLVRAPIDGAPDPAAWSAWDGAGWNSDLGRAATVLHGPPGDLSVSYNAARGAFLAVYSGIFSDDILFRTAPRPEGPWSDARTLFQAIAPASGNDYAGKEHPELARDGGGQVVVSYARSTGAFAGEVRLAQAALPP
ncbi:MAG TPA: DUF4185 domain-containing protein [Polyangia bacterium]|nr:DUF4185 domain-containing protein [Polyangia bacterium]